MELFVKEMPKSCVECKYKLFSNSCMGNRPCYCGLELFLDTGDVCTGNGSISIDLYKNERHKDCPLKPLPKRECEHQKSKEQLKKDKAFLFDRVCELEGKNQELQEKLAVAEKELSDAKLAIKIVAKHQSYEEFRKSFVEQQATAELKAEKGDGNGSK